MSFLLTFLGAVATPLLIILLICTVGAMCDLQRRRKGTKMDLRLQLLGLLGALALCTAWHTELWIVFSYIAAAFFPLGLACLIELFLERLFDNDVSLTGHHGYWLGYNVHGKQAFRYGHFLRRTWRIPVDVIFTAICAALLIGHSDGWHVAAVVVGTGIALRMVISRRKQAAAPQC